MSIQASCPECRSRFTLADDLAGKKVRCNRCQEVFEAPARSREDVTAAPVARKAGPARRGSADDRPVRAAKKMSVWGWVGLGLAGVGALMALVFLAGVVVMTLLGGRSN